jgi:release factor glutamine methyltransferase
MVSNPPYIRSRVIPELDPQVRQFEPHLALDGGPDGLACYRRIWSEAQKWAFPQTQVMVEVGFDQAELVEEIAREKGWSQTRVVADMARIPRVVIGSRPVVNTNV